MWHQKSAAVADNFDRGEKKEKKRRKGEKGEFEALLLLLPSFFILHPTAT